VVGGKVHTGPVFETECLHKGVSCSLFCEVPKTKALTFPILCKAEWTGAEICVAHELRKGVLEYLCIAITTPLCIVISGIARRRGRTANCAQYRDYYEVPAEVLSDERWK
jgi:hypothetical protein